MKKYCCDDWDENILKVEGPIILQSVMAGRDLYTGKPFTHCPWCGLELTEQIPLEQLPTLAELRGILKDEANPKPIT